MILPKSLCIVGCLSCLLHPFKTSCEMFSGFGSYFLKAYRRELSYLSLGCAVVEEPCKLTLFVTKNVQLIT